MHHNDPEILAQKIRAQYVKPEHTKLDALKALDKKVRKPALLFAWIFGILGSLVLGAGMSLALDAIPAGNYCGILIGEHTMLPGIILGVAGLFLVLVNYPIYKRILSGRKKKYAGQILALSDAVIGQEA